jgi:uncharacterized damage-inducible protein DinB
MAEPLEQLAAPARRALASIGVARLKDIATHTEEQIASLHGIGPKAIAQLKDALSERGLSFRRSGGDTRTSLRVEPLSSCPPVIGHSLWTLEEARRRTLRYLVGISEHALDHTPPGHRHNVATLLYHLAGSEMDWLYGDMSRFPPQVAERLPYPRKTEDGRYTPVSGESLDVHLQRLHVTRSVFIDEISSMTVADFRIPRPSDDGHVTPEWVVQHLAQHEAEHRGQIWEARNAAEHDVS